MNEKSPAKKNWSQSTSTFVNSQCFDLNLIIVCIFHKTKNNSNNIISQAFSLKWLAATLLDGVVLLFVQQSRLNYLPLQLLFTYSAHIILWFESLARLSDWAGLFQQLNILGIAVVCCCCCYCCCCFRCCCSLLFFFKYVQLKGTSESIFEQNIFRVDHFLIIECVSCLFHHTISLLAKFVSTLFVFCPFCLCVSFVHFSWFVISEAFCFVFFFSFCSRLGFTHIWSIHIFMHTCLLLMIINMLVSFFFLFILSIILVDKHIP